MKTKILLLIFLPLFSFGQNDITFKINHLLDGKEGFSTTDKGKNNLSSTFTLNRMQYYISDISILHDGGQTLSFDDTTILIDAYSESNITLGNFDVNNLERVTFHLGVKQALNHLDPALYDASHPLSPKSPSMHWGWTSGYRFFAIEGSSEGQVFELHGVGNALYDEIIVDFSETSSENGVLVIDINAEYNEALKDLDLVSGLSIHGDENNPEIVIEKNNFKNGIFSANEGVETPTNISRLAFDKELITVFPNPTNGLLRLNNNDIVKEAKIYNSIGLLVSKESVLNNTIQLSTKGIYFIHFIDEANQLISINKVVVQ